MTDDFPALFTSMSLSGENDEWRNGEFNKTWQPRYDVKNKVKNEKLHNIDILISVRVNG